jgi:hypothetical protein
MGEKFIEMISFVRAAVYRAEGRRGDKKRFDRETNEAAIFGSVDRINSNPLL